MAVRTEKFIGLIGVLLLALLASTDLSWAKSLVNLNHPAFATVGSTRTSIPIGHAEFCRAHTSECTANVAFSEAAQLTEKKWLQLLEINSQFNAAIQPITDRDLYQVSEFWTYPSGYGDCEDYVLAKRRALIENGWQPSTLLIAVVRQSNGEGHAVLMVRTDRGDLVLDNQESLIKTWNDTPYHYIKRQSQFNAGEWVDIYDSRPITVASR